MSFLDQRDVYEECSRWQRSSRRVEKLGSILWLLAVAFLGVVAGGFLVLAKVPPAGLFYDAHRAALALYQKEVTYRDVHDTSFWNAARGKRSGVTVYDAKRVQPGLTLYTSGHAAKALLVSPKGQILHEWHRPFSSVWDDSAAVRRPLPDSHVSFHKVHLLPNGDLLAIYEGSGDTPWGYGMVKLDREGGLLWKYLERTHHDFDVAADGRIYVLTHEFRTEEMAGLDHLEFPVLEDFLVILSPDGKELKKISILEAVARSRYELLLRFVRFSSLYDPLHTNSVEVLDAEEASQLPQASEGQVLLSFREAGIGTIGLLDVEREEIVWALRGPWLTVHDPDVLPNGNLLLFDNLGNSDIGGKSRVLEVNPRTSEIVWSYAGNAAHFFETALKGSQERLPDGNTLVTESDAGRIFEVTLEGDLVWEFVNPVRSGKDGTLIPTVAWAQRIEWGSLAAEFFHDLRIALARLEPTP